jgi:hypothetical protein
LDPHASKPALWCPGPLLCWKQAALSQSQGPRPGLTKYHLHSWIWRWRFLSGASGMPTQEIYELRQGSRKSGPSPSWLSEALSLKQLFTWRLPVAGQMHWGVQLWALPPGRGVHSG